MLNRISAVCDNCAKLFTTLINPSAIDINFRWTRIWPNVWKFISTMQDFILRFWVGHLGDFFCIYEGSFPPPNFSVGMSVAYYLSKMSE